MQRLPILPRSSKLQNRTIDETLNASIRQLRIAPIPSWMKLSAVAQYCENFGKINYAKLCPEQLFGYGLVQFESADDARTVLRKRYHRIENCILNVEPADDQSVESNEVVENFARLTFTPFLNLDDECLLKIFDELDKIELCDVANTCKRFKKIAEQIFSSKFDDGNHVAEGEINNDVQKLYETFGALMTNIRIGFNENKSQAEVFKFIARYCGDKLLYLRIVNLGLTDGNCRWLDDDTKTKLKSLFSHLQFLDFHAGKFFDFATAKEILATCSNLKTLWVLCATDDTWNKLDIHFPKLQELRFNLCDQINDEGFERFLTANPGIMSLDLYLCENLTSKLFQIIAHRLPNLEAISLNCHFKNLGPEIDLLPQLNRLQHLSVFEPALLFVNAIWKTELQVESFGIFDEDMNIIPDLILAEVLPKLRRVKKLTFQQCSMADKHLEMFAKGLPNLTELRIESPVTVNALKKVLVLAKNLTYLLFESWGNDGHFELLLFALEHFKGRDLTIENAPFGVPVKLEDFERILDARSK